MAINNRASSFRLVESLFLPLVTVGLILLLFLMYHPSQAAGGAYIVNSTADTDDGVCDATNCTLREAIKAANSSGGAGTITFSLPPNATITLAGTQLPPIMVDLVIDGRTAVNLTISGNNTSRVLVIGPNPPSYPGYPFTGGQTNGFGGGPIVDLIDLTITKGNKANDRGGGIYNQGTLSIQNSTISNLVSRHGGIFNDGNLTIVDTTVVNNLAANLRGAGAGIYNDRDANLTVQNSTFISNTINTSTSFGGAAIYNVGGDVSISDSLFSDNYDWFISAIRSRSPGMLTIINSTFSNNSVGRAVSGGRDTMIEDSLFSGNSGGALNISGDEATIENSVFLNNSADFGGAVDLESFSTLDIENSSFTGNFAVNRGGAIASLGDLNVTDSVFSDNASSGSGGAIQIGSGGSLHVDGSTFEGNSALNGGAVQLVSGFATFVNTTISGNWAQNRGGGLRVSGNLSLNNTTISGNWANSGGGIHNAAIIYVSNTIIANSPSGGDCVNNGGTIQTNVNNLVEDGSCNPTFNGDPLLSGLQDNGGPTWTHYPLAASIVVDKGDNASCMNNDQRDVPRPIDGNEDGTADCDIGAVERGSFFVVNSANDVDTSVCNASHCSLREAIKAANSASGADVIQFNIPGTGPHTIQPLSPLPNITGAVLINGYSQPGAMENTILGQPGGNAVLQIELDGSNAGPSATGLSLTRSYIVVKGLVINRFGQHGLRIVGSQANWNDVLGNFIGTDINGSANLGNGGANVYIGSGASHNVIGGNEASDGNIIAFAGMGGVVIDGSNSVENEVRSNAIHSNGLLGIDLGDDGLTNNDPGDGDMGANGLQNYPVLTLATADVGSTIISGSLNSTVSTLYTLEFFANSACDGTGQGEGERPIGTAMVVTDSSGDVGFEVTVPYETPLDHFVTATATDPAGNSSEFSPCMSVVDAPISGLVATNSSPTMLSLPTTLIANITTGGNVSYTWEFGDGEGGIGRLVTHVYPAEGWYTAVVTASNSINMMTTTTFITITEYIPPPPTDVSLTTFGRELAGIGWVLFPLAVALVGVGIMVLVVFGRRRE